jgi:hypothetical protein
VKPFFESCVPILCGEASPSPSQIQSSWLIPWFTGWYRNTTTDDDVHSAGKDAEMRVHRRLGELVENFGSGYPENFYLRPTI